MSSDSDDDHSTTQVGEESSADEDLAVNDKVADDDGEHVVRDVIMWRRREISAVVVLVTTALWVLLQVFAFNFVHLASWTLIAFATLLFFYGSINRLLHKEVPYMTRWEMTEQRAKEMGESAKWVMEKGIRWMFYVSCEGEWYIFLGVTAALFLLAYVGRYIDLITLVYAGTMVGMSGPVIYVKKEDALKEYVKKLKEKGRSMYHKFDDKVFSRLNLQKKEKKEKKVQ